LGVRKEPAAVDEAIGIRKNAVIRLENSFDGLNGRRWINFEKDLGTTDPAQGQRDRHRDRVNIHSIVIGELNALTIQVESESDRS
jgi:hypothetical protein